jgi:hypothetical protein
MMMMSMCCRGRLEKMLLRCICALRPRSIFTPTDIFDILHLAENATQANGSSHYGKNVVKELQGEEKIEQAAVHNLSGEQDHVLKTFRLLTAELC